MAIARTTGSGVIRRASMAIKKSDTTEDAAAVLSEWLNLNAREADLKRQIRTADTELDALAYAKHPELTESEIKTLVVDECR